MKLCRKISMCLLLILSILSLSACGGKRPEATAVYVDKDGNLKQILVDASPEYSLEGLRDFTEDKIKTYLKENENGEIRMDSCEEKNGIVYLELSYGRAADYAEFNRMSCFLGTLNDAALAGIVPEGNLTAPDGSAVDFASLQEEHPEYYLLSLSENIIVQTDRRIQAVSSLVTVSSENTAVIGDGDAGTSGYYPRKTAASAYLIFG